MFGEDRSQSPRMPSPWMSRLSTSLDVAASRGPSPLSMGASSDTRRRASNARHQLELDLAARDQPSFTADSASNASTAVGSSPRLGYTAQGGEAPSSYSPSLAPLNPEEDTIGNIEYKLKLLPPTRDRFNRLVTQLKWRLLQGGGMAIYEIGVLDDGALVGLTRREMRASLDTLEAMSSQLGARVEVRRVIVVQRQLAQASSTSGASSPFAAPSSSVKEDARSNPMSRPTGAIEQASSPLEGDVANRVNGPSDASGRSASRIRPGTSLPGNESSPPLRTMAQFNAATKMFNEAYLLRELGAKRRGCRAGPTDIIHLGLLDATQARKWIGGGRRTFSADLRLDNAAVGLRADQTMLRSSSSNSQDGDQIGAEMDLPLVTLSAAALAHEVEQDRLIEQWEEDVKRRRAEAAATALSNYESVSNADNGSDGRVSQRQRRRHSSNMGENGSPTIAGTAYPGSIRKAWLPEYGTGTKSIPERSPTEPGHTSRFNDTPLEQPGVKEGSGPVRIVQTAGSLPNQQTRLHGCGQPLLEDQVGSTDSSTDGSDDGASDASGGDDDEDGGFFSFSLSLSDDEDGQIKGGRRKKEARERTSKPKNGVAPSSHKARHSNQGFSGAGTDQSSGSPDKAEFPTHAKVGAGIGTDALLADHQVSPGRDTPPVSPAGNGLGLQVVSDSPASASDGAAASAGTGPLDNSTDTSPPASTNATSTKDLTTLQEPPTAIRFIVEAKVLRKLRKGDVFIDYAGI